MVDTIASLFSSSRDSSPRFGGSAAAAPGAPGFAALVDRFDAEASRALAPASAPAARPRRLAEGRSAAHAERTPRRDDARDRAPARRTEARRDRSTAAQDRARGSTRGGRREDGDDDDDGSARESGSTRSQTDASLPAAFSTVVGAGFGVAVTEAVGEATLGSPEGGSPAGAESAATLTTARAATSAVSDATTAAPGGAAVGAALAAARAEGLSDGQTTSAPPSHADLRDGKEGAGLLGQAGGLAGAPHETSASSPSGTAGQAADAGLAQAGSRGVSSDGPRTVDGERRATHADALGLTVAAARPEDGLVEEAAAFAGRTGGEETDGKHRAQGRPDLSSQPGGGAGAEARGGLADGAAPTAVVLPHRTHQAAGHAGVAPVSSPEPSAPSTASAILAPVHGRAPATSSVASAKTSAVQPARVEATPDGVGSALRQVVKRGQDRVEIRLDPPRLGRLKIEVRRGQDGTLQVRLHAEQHEAAEMLRRSTRQLEAILGRDGVRLDRIEVTQPALEARGDRQETFLPHDGRQAGSGSGGEAGASGDRGPSDGSAGSQKEGSGWRSLRPGALPEALDAADGWRGDRLDAIA